MVGGVNWIIKKKNSLFYCKKQIGDPKGRYLFLQGTLQDIEFTILTYYAPNENPGPLLTYIFPLLTCHQAGTLLHSEDLNLILNTEFNKYP